MALTWPLKNRFLLLWRQKGTREWIRRIVLRNYSPRSGHCKSQSSAYLLVHANSSNEVSRTGGITDGLKWTFYHRFKDKWYTLDLFTNDQQGCLRLLRTTPTSKLANVVGVLTCLVAGKFPVPDQTNPLWIVE